MLTCVMQYCDGVLDSKNSARVAEEIAADRALQALAQDLRLGATAARYVMASVMEDPVPIRLVQAITERLETAPSIDPFQC